VGLSRHARAQECGLKTSLTEYTAAGANAVEIFLV